MAALTKELFIVAAKRTPFGTYGGKFLKKSVTDLQEVANKTGIAAAGLKLKKSHRGHGCLSVVRVLCVVR
jgi:acetyl-CoA acyltransferase 2